MPNRKNSNIDKNGNLTKVPILFNIHIADKKRLICFLLFLLIIPKLTIAQNTLTLTGHIRDFETHKPISNVSVYISTQNIGTTTDLSGHFKLKIGQNTTPKILISHLSYTPQTIDIKINRDTTIYVELQNKKVELGEVAILFDSKKPTLMSEIGREDIKQKEILSLPTLLGSQDILRSVINLPGISKGNEGDGGIYVRGGEAGQNTVILDNIEIINPTHVLGMYSVFNPYTTQKVTVYKGASPIFYDRKISSAIIVQSINNDTNRVKATINLGNILTDFGLSGSSQNKRFSYTFGARKSYLEAYSGLARLLFNNSWEDELKKNMVGFYDFNGQMVFRNNNKSIRSLSWYLGKDYVTFNSEQASLKTKIDWQNRGIAYSSKHYLKNQQSIETVINYSDYIFKFDGEVITKDIKISTAYSHLKLKSFYQQITKHYTLIGGIGSGLFHFTPKNATYSSTLQEINYHDTYKALENSGFASIELNQMRNWVVYAGFKLNNFIFLGPYQYQTGNDSTNIIYSDNQIVKMYFTPEISLSASHSFNPNMMLKMAYLRNSQNTHLGMISSVALPADLFMPSTKRIKPEYSSTFSAGININSIFTENYSLSLDAYYKTMQNLLIYKMNYNSEVRISNIEDQFYSGIGWASGLELSFVKKKGALTGNISASISKSRRKFNDVNDGKWFDSKYDRIGDISTTLQYAINPKYSLTANWVFTGGMKTTLPTGRYWLLESVMNDYEGVNNIRLPSYHRLDIGLTILLKSERFKESLLTLSLVNAYNRKNPFFVNYGIESPNDNPYLLRVFATQLSLIPILPSISWKIVF